MHISDCDANSTTSFSPINIRLFYHDAIMEDKKEHRMCHRLNLICSNLKRTFMNGTCQTQNLPWSDTQVWNDTGDEALSCTTSELPRAGRNSDWGLHYYTRGLMAETHTGCDVVHLNLHPFPTKIPRCVFKNEVMFQNTCCSKVHKCEDLPICCLPCLSL